MENNKVEFLINMINDMDIKDKLRLAICMSQSKWSWLIYNTKEYYKKFINAYVSEMKAGLNKDFKTVDEFEEWKKK